MGRYPHLKRSAPEIILEEIMIAGEKGITQQKLRSNMTNTVNRSTIFRVTKKYQREGKIKIIKESNMVRYIATTKVPLDASLGGFMLSEAASSKWLNFPHFYQKSSSREFSKTVNYSLQKALKEFSANVGGIITFILIQGLNPDNKLLSRKDGRNVEKKLLREWINNAVSPYLVSRMMHQFQLLIYASISRQSELPKGIELTRDFTFEESLSSNDIAVKLSKAFAKLYPDMSKDLDDIMKNILEKTEARRK
jgi:hypothetical protein